MSSANELQLQAEDLLNLCGERHPNGLVLKLAQVLLSSQSLEIRAMATVFLCKQATSSSGGDLDESWSRLTPATQSSIKSLLLSAVQQEERKCIAKKLCDTVSELASILLPYNAWPELLPFLFQAANSDSPRLQESALLIFSQLGQYIRLFLHHLATLRSVFLNSLSHSSSPDVRIAALRASINFVLPLTADRELFEDLLPAMMGTLTEALNSGKEAIAKEDLKLLIELAGTEPWFFISQLANVVGSMLQISDADYLEEGTRHLAVEFVITVAEACEQSPGMMTRLLQFVGSIFDVLMKMLLDIEVEDESAWHGAETTEAENAEKKSNFTVGKEDKSAWHWAETTEAENAEKKSKFIVAKECLHRLSMALGGNTIVPVALKLLPCYLTNPTWQKRHAALIALSRIAEGCAKVMIENLEQILPMATKSITDPHRCVSQAALNTIGQFAIVFGPFIQKHYAQLLLNLDIWNDIHDARVQAQADILLRYYMHEGHPC